MELNRRIMALKKLGEFLIRAGIADFENEPDPVFKEHQYLFEQLVRTVYEKNPWFLEVNVRYALTALGNMLCENDILKWVSMYARQLEIYRDPLTIGVVMAGNIPFV